METLIATGILIIVTLAVVSLSNSLISGTVNNADKTITNRWAAEGIELTTKIRDDRILDKTTAPNWFDPAIAENGSGYGWYVLTPGTPTASMSRAAVGNVISANDFKNSGAEVLTSDRTIGYRLICVEAVGAATAASSGQFSCNTRAGQAVADGVRTPPTDCPDPNPDLYCYTTRSSVNKNQLTADRFIPAGTAVKVRAVVIWETKDGFRSSSLATVLTNWKGYEQN